LSARFKRDGGAVIGPYRLTCSGCGAVEEVKNTKGGNMPHDVVGKKFQQLGWDVGSRPSKDKCPRCKQGPEMRYTVDKNLRVEVPKPTLTVVETPMVAKLDRETRRIILAKLDDVYMDETMGYQMGWTDQRVADDLGVDVQWIEELRVENFGDLPVSAQDRSFLDEGHKILEQIREVALEAAAAKDRAETLIQDAMKALDDITALDRKLDDLLAQEQLLAEQIAKVSHAA